MTFAESHYGILEPILPRFFQLVGVPGEDVGIQSAHGDKVLQYKKQYHKCHIEDWEAAALYYLTYTSKYGRESRETRDGWVPPVDWVTANYERFVPALHQAFNEHYVLNKKPE